MLEARFLGQFEICIDGALIEIPARKAQSLLAYLLVNSGKQFRREQLAGQLWPDYDEPQARSKLRYALWQLRNAVGEKYFSADKLSLGINPTMDFWIDCRELAGESPDHPSITELKNAVSLYQGEFLPGFYEDWIFLLRDQLRAIYDNKIAQLIQLLSRRKRWREVLEWGERWVSYGEIPEPAFQAIMIAHSQLGDMASASKAYLRLEQSLKEELGVEPSEQTRHLYSRILQGELVDIVLDYTDPNSVKPGRPARTRPDFEEIESNAERAVFVAREEELDWLDAKLKSALRGEGQLAFVAGGSGQGKTALVQNFSLRAQEMQDNLVVAYATCEDFSGLGDPYLPFRNILALLSGDVAAKQSPGLINQENAQRLWELIPEAVQVLLDEGPDLLGNFVSGDAMVRRASSYTVDQPDWLVHLEREVDLRKRRPVPIHIDHGNSEKDLYEQCCRVLQKLSSSHPLVLIIDDMQWADSGTMGLLFHLARRIERNQILILGSYRPIDLAQNGGRSKHPLFEMLPEFKRRFGEIEINLDSMRQEDQQGFIKAYLDSEPNKFSQEFHQALYLQTAGHPLFTVELLRQMQEQGSIIKDSQGRWVESDQLSWDGMPARVEAVIESRINRLSPQQKEILNVASVEGEEFTAEILAGVIQADPADIKQQLSQDLARRYKLVEVSEIRHLGLQRQSVYRFRHNLFQRYLYENLDDVEKTTLHEMVGIAMEQVYSGHTEEAAVQLARHFEYSGEIEKAVDYLLLAGKQAKKVSANEQAITQLSKAVELLEQLPHSRRRVETELALQVALGAPLVAVQGYASPQVEATFERARELCEQTGDRQQLAPALWGLCAFYQVRGKHLTAHQLANQILELAENGEADNLMLLGHWMLGLTHTHLGEFALARVHIETALKIDDRVHEDFMTYQYGQNPRVTCLIYLALNLWILGYLDQAVEKSLEAIDYAEQISHPYSLTFAHGMTALFHSLRNDPQTALLHSNTAYRLAREARFPFFLSLSMIIRGWGRTKSGKTGMAGRLIENGIEGMRAIGVELALPYFLSLLAEVYREGDKIKSAAQQVEAALSKAKENHEHWYQSGLNCLLGDLLDEQGIPDKENLPFYLRANEIAAQQEAKTFELQSTIALTRLELRGDHAGKYWARLGEISQWFQEGLDDPLLVEARALAGQ